MTSIFKKAMGCAVHTFLIHTDDERVFDVVLLCDEKRYYRRSGFRSWMDAYDHGARAIGLRSGHGECGKYGNAPEGYSYNTAQSAA